MRPSIPPDSSIITILKAYSDKLTISQIMVFFERQGMAVTKTTVQNYIRVGVLPPPDKRRYTKNHVLLILLIGYLKTVYSLDEIKTILDPVLAASADGAINIEETYENFCASYANKSDALSEALANAPDAGSAFDIKLSAAAEGIACKNY